jgi:hypothetical protein
MFEQTKPRWGKRSAASHRSGLSIRLIDDLVARSIIRSSLVRQPGRERGVRLIDLDSLDAYIEAGVGQVTDLEMNRGRGRKARTEAAAARGADQ